jgi:SSS family solute:Na+ symporter
MVQLSAVDWLIIAVYLASMVVLGVILARRGGSFGDFFLAGRTLTTPLLIATLVSSYYGIDVLLGNTQLAFTDGVVAWFGYARPAYLFLLIAAFVVAVRLQKAHFISLPDVMSRYYGRGAGYTGAVAAFVYSLPATSLYGFGVIGEFLFGWPPLFSILLFGGVALVYTLAGGFLAVAFTDAVQFLIMCVMLAIAIPFSLQLIGGFDTMFDTLGAEYFLPMGDLSPWLILVYAATNLVVFVEPSFYQRIFAARSFRVIRNAFLIGIVLWGAFDWIVTVLGMVAQTAMLQGSIDPAIAADQSLFAIMFAVLPAGLLGLFLAGVLAAQMSTLDSYCLVAGGNLSYDIYRPLVRPRATDRELVRMTRVGVVIAWVCGAAMALSFGQMLGLWVFLASFLISTVLVPILLGLYIPAWRVPLAGFLSSLLGLTAVVGANLAVVLGGDYLDTAETHVLTVSVAGRSFAILQEYTMLFSLPVSVFGFFAGLLIHRFGRSGGRP